MFLHEIWNIRQMESLSITMSRASLQSYCSLVRGVEGECSFVSLSEGRVVAGSKSGEVVCWDMESGNEKWRMVFEGPCSDSEIREGVLFFTESNKVHSIQISSGEALWSLELEGSSDFVRCSEEGVFVSTSVYNFEIQDYSEGAIWQIEFTGELRRSWPTIGRIWSLSVYGNKAVFGLSRPKCGIAVLSGDEDLDYISLSGDYPVTVGKGDDRGLVVLGHSNGVISEISGGEFSYTVAGNSSICSIDYENDWIVGLEEGIVVSGESFDSWTIDLGSPVELISFGPSLSKRRAVWACTWKDEAILYLIELTGEIELIVSHSSRISAIFNNDEMICFGDSDGNVYLLEGEVLRRRHGRSEEELMQDEKRFSLRRKMRELRGS